MLATFIVLFLLAELDCQSKLFFSSVAVFHFATEGGRCVKYSTKRHVCCRLHCRNWAKQGRMWAPRDSNPLLWFLIRPSPHCGTNVVLSYFILVWFVLPFTAHRSVCSSSLNIIKVAFLWPCYMSTSSYITAQKKLLCFETKYVAKANNLEFSNTEITCELLSKWTDSW